jgi:hypothetical protein
MTSERMPTPCISSWPIHMLCRLSSTLLYKQLFLSDAFRIGHMYNQINSLHYGNLSRPKFQPDDRSFRSPRPMFAWKTKAATLVLYAEHCARMDERAVEGLYYALCGVWDVGLCRFLLDRWTQRMEALHYPKTCVQSTPKTCSSVH